MNGMTAAPRNGIAEKLKSVIDTLNESCQKMEDALVTHDVPRIWTILADQERSAAEFQQYSAVWGQFASANRGKSEVEETIHELEQACTRVRERSRSNMYLIKSFLSAIAKSFRSTGTQNARISTGYSKRGKMNYRQTSLLLNRQG